MAGLIFVARLAIVPQRFQLNLLKTCFLGRGALIREGMVGRIMQVNNCCVAAYVIANVVASQYVQSVFHGRCMG